MEILNAKIDSTYLGFKHGIFTINFYLEYGNGCSQGIPEYSLGGEECPAFIKKLFEVVGVDSWDELQGKHIRVGRNDNLNPTVIAIGHIIEERWLNFEEFFAPYRREVRTRAAKELKRRKKVIDDFNELHSPK